MAIKLSDDELMSHFLNTAKEIQTRCDAISTEKCNQGQCSFSRDGACIFGWHKDFNYPYDWKIDDEEE